MAVNNILEQMKNEIVKREGVDAHDRRVVHGMSSRVSH